MKSPVEIRQALSSWAWQQFCNHVAESPPGSNDGDPMRLYALPRETPMAWCARMQRAGLLATLADNVDVDTFARTFTPAERYDMASARLFYAVLKRHGAIDVEPLNVRQGDYRFLVSNADVYDLANVLESDGGIHHVGIVCRRYRAVSSQGSLNVDRLVIVDGNWNERVCANDLSTFDPYARYVRFPVG